MSAVAKPTVEKPVAHGVAKESVKPSVLAPKPAASDPPTKPAQAVFVEQPTKPVVEILDVQFRDSTHAARVEILVRGQPEITKLAMEPGQPRASLQFKGAVLPKQLARTLDTTAFHGPVTSVSAYLDPEQPGAVRLVAQLAAATEPELKMEPTRRRHGAKPETKIVWRFPKAVASSGSFPPAKVAGFGLNTLPLQVAEPPKGPPQPPQQPASPPPTAPGPPAGDSSMVQSRPLVGSMKKYAGRRMDLDFKDADIHNLLRLISDVGQVNIVTTDDVKGAVTIRMRDVPWDQALEVILRAKGLGMVRERNLIRVAPQGVLEKELEQEISRREHMVQLQPPITRLIPVSYAEATKIIPRVQDVLSGWARISVDDRTNTLIVSDLPGNIKNAEELVRSLDTPTPEVLIEARIVEADSKFSRGLGIQWGGGGIASAATGNPTGIGFPSTIGIAGAAGGAATDIVGLSGSPNYVVNLPGGSGVVGLNLGSLTGNYNLNLRLSAEESTGNIRILSAPKITTLDNVEASILSGTAIPITVVSALGPQTTFVDANLSLTVKPHVTNDGSIMMVVNVTKNQPDQSVQTTGGTPGISRKVAKTEMLVADGDTAVIGGIYQRTTSANQRKIPFLGDIPILGWLFKNKTESDNRTELLIFITPRIVNRATALRR